MIQLRREYPLIGILFRNLIHFCCRNTTEITDYTNGYKHIVAVVKGFDQQIADFGDNPEELETLISIVSIS